MCTCRSFLFPLHQSKELGSDLTISLVPVQVIQNEVKEKDKVPELPPPRPLPPRPIEDETTPAGPVSLGSLRAFNSVAMGKKLRMRVTIAEKSEPKEHLMDRVPKKLMFVDKRKSGFVNLYQQSFKDRMRDTERLKMWSRIAFRELDADRKGGITLEDIKRMFHSLDLHLSPNELEVVFAVADVNASGFIDEDEFENLLLGVQRAHQLGMAIDPAPPPEPPVVMLKATRSFNS